MSYPPGRPSSNNLSDLDRLLAMLDFDDIFDGNRRGTYTEVTIGSIERSTDFTTFRLPVTKPFEMCDALELAPALLPYTHQLLDCAYRSAEHRPLVVMLLTAMAATFHNHSDDPVLYADIHTALTQYGTPSTTYRASAVPAPSSSRSAVLS